jgi:hypothetical protein
MLAGIMYFYQNVVHIGLLDFNPCKNSYPLNRSLAGIGTNGLLHPRCKRGRGILNQLASVLNLPDFVNELLITYPAKWNPFFH